MKFKTKFKKKMKKYKWIFILIISVVIAMYIYGMANHYYPEPVHIGFGHYMDISTGVTIIGLLISAFVLTIIFKEEKKVVRKEEYQAIKKKR